MRSGRGRGEPPEEVIDSLSVIDSSVHILRARLGDDPHAAKHLERISSHLLNLRSHFSKLTDG